MGALARLYHDHAGRLVDARHGTGEPTPVQQLAQHAIAALAPERALHSRWINFADALTYGASLGQVAAAWG